MGRARDEGSLRLYFRNGNFSQPMTSSTEHFRSLDRNNFLCSVLISSNFSNAPSLESLRVLTMLVTKICTNTFLCFFSSLSTYLFSIMYMNEWKNVKSETVRFFRRNERFFLSFLPADIEKDGRLFLKLKFCVFREQYTPRLWIFWKLHVLPFSCSSFFCLPSTKSFADFNQK